MGLLRDLTAYHQTFQTQTCNGNVLKNESIWGGGGAYGISGMFSTSMIQKTIKIYLNNGNGIYILTSVVATEICIHV
jgi:hypothetical protein